MFRGKITGFCQFEPKLSISTTPSSPEVIGKISCVANRDIEFLSNFTTSEINLGRKKKNHIVLPSWTKPYKIWSSISGAKEKTTWFCQFGPKLTRPVTLCTPETSGEADVKAGNYILCFFGAAT
jgi:hypothetical protein